MIGKAYPVFKLNKVGPYAFCEASIFFKEGNFISKSIERYRYLVNI